MKYAFLPALLLIFTFGAHVHADGLDDVVSGVTQTASSVPTPVTTSVSVPSTPATPASSVSSGDTSPAAVTTPAADDTSRNTDSYNPIPQASPEVTQALETITAQPTPTTKHTPKKTVTKSKTTTTAPTTPTKTANSAAPTRTSITVTPTTTKATTTPAVASTKSSNLSAALGDATKALSALVASVGSPANAQGDASAVANTNIYSESTKLPVTETLALLALDIALILSGIFLIRRDSVKPSVSKYARRAPYRGEVPTN